MMRHLKGHRNAISQAIKDFVIRQGPTSVALRAALSLHARRHGFSTRFTEESITIRKGRKEIILANEQFVQVPIMMEEFELFFSTIDCKAASASEILDFSRPGMHRYKRSGVAFYFPSIPEDDVLEAYTHAYSPKAGDVVWDAGAHAGATVYDLSRAVGPSGRVIAFEPDESNYDYLKKNISLHNLTNVVTVRKALTRATGPVMFQMDGTMSAGIRDFLLYSNSEHVKTVDGISLQDACAEFGCPQFIKMDIEGAEVATVEGSAEFLRKNFIHFAIESYHPVNGELTYLALERFFPTIDYSVESSTEFGQMFTWATPPPEAEKAL